MSDAPSDDVQIEILEIVGVRDDDGPCVDIEPDLAMEIEEPSQAAASPRISEVRETGRMHGVRQVLRELLPALDDLEACVRQEADVATIREGVKIGLRRLLDVFRVFELERIEGTGMEFDPALHDAVAVTETERVPPNRVVEVLRVGYALRGELVRPALVRVSAPKGEEEIINERFRRPPDSGAGESRT